MRGRMLSSGAPVSIRGEVGAGGDGVCHVVAQQHRAHAVGELGVVAAPLPPLQGQRLARDGALGQALEGDDVEAAPLDQLDRRLPAVSGEACAGADPHPAGRHRPLPLHHGRGRARQDDPFPRAARIRRQSESGLSGSSVISMPKGSSASQIALQSVPGTSEGRPSPMPRLPSGV